MLLLLFPSASAPGVTGGRLLRLWRSDSMRPSTKACDDRRDDGDEDTPGGPSGGEGGAFRPVRRRGGFGGLAALDSSRSRQASRSFRLLLIGASGEMQSSSSSIFDRQKFFEEAFTCAVTTIVCDSSICGYVYGPCPSCGLCLGVRTFPFFIGGTHSLTAPLCASNGE